MNPFWTTNMTTSRDRSAPESRVEAVLEIRSGDRAPEGYEILRILATREEPTGTGTSTRTVYIVSALTTEAAERLTPSPDAGSTRSGGDES